MDIFLPPGLGDTYWCLTKLESYKKRNNVNYMRLVIMDNKTLNRSLDFLKRIDFVDDVTYTSEVTPYENNETDKEMVDLFHEMLSITDPQGIVENFKYKNHTYDALLCFNRAMENGISLDNIMPEYETNWYLNLKPDPDHERYKTYIRDTYDTKYVVLFVVNPDNPMYDSWRTHVGYDTIYKLASNIYSTYNYKSVIVGREWDSGISDIFSTLDKNNIILDYIGKSPFNKMLGLFEGSEAVIGDAAGNVLLAPMFGVKTFCFWSKEFFSDQRFNSNSVTPDSVNRWYFPIEVSEYDEPFIIKKLGSK